MKINHLISLLTLSFAVASQSFGCNKNDIVITSLPFEASVSNRVYCLARDLTFDARINRSTNAIVVRATDAVINLNGKTLSAANLPKDKMVIGVYSNADSVTVRNGRIDGFDIGVQLLSNDKVTITKLKITNGKYSAISARANVVDISFNEISSLESRWARHTSVISIEKSKAVNIYQNTIKNVITKNSNPEPDLWIPFYGAHGISTYEFERLNIYNNSLSNLVTKDGEISYVSLLPSSTSHGRAYIYNNNFSYPINYSASKRQNLAFATSGDNSVTLYNNQFSGFLRNVMNDVMSDFTNTTYFNNIFYRYKFNKKYEPIFPKDKRPIDAGGNQLIYR
jgi:hypothetical protein